MTKSPSPWIICKFGGTSVSTRERWLTISRVVGDHLKEGRRPLVVCSALRGVSDTLEELIEAARKGEHEPVIERLEAAHQDLATELGVSLDEPSGEKFAELRRLATGASMLMETTPRLKAQIMAAGEFLSTRLGLAFLASRGIPVRWMDVREMLESLPESPGDDRRTYLAATCAAVPDPELEDKLGTDTGQAVITQGFVASSPAGETVLLGRGGSDTSASYLAAKLSAVRCEIWTDVPGLFSANPHQVPTARLLRRLHYNEAEEIALTGAKVLHPRCIAPLRQQGIPLYLCCTDHPEIEGTIVDGKSADERAQVKAISARSDIVLISMESVGMWHRVGFLADVFGCFKANGLSVDLVATSETNVTVSLDPSANSIASETMEALLADLSTMCTARTIGPCASISLVGRNIRAILHQLGSAFEVFEEERIHLMTQAASDLNLTFVVDEDQAERLVSRLHAMLFAARPDDGLLGRTWEELVRREIQVTETTSPPWWMQKRDQLLAVAASETPAYVYDRSVLEATAAAIRALSPISRVFYAIKANPHAEILRCFEGAGLGFECASIGELSHILATLPGIAPDRILFTPNYAARGEYEAAIAAGTHVTLDGIEPLRCWPELFTGIDVLLRVDPGRGQGHHPYVHTAGPQSKFGIAYEQLELAAELARAAGARVTGMHAHIGSGIRTSGRWAETALFLEQVTTLFPDVRVLDLGGGLGVPEKPGQRALDLEQLSESLEKFNRAHPGFELWLEPGRFMVATAGVLLARVNQVKSKGQNHYIGIDAGLNSLLRPALYGAWHEIVNLSQVDEPPTMVADIVGPICESGDTMGYGRVMPDSVEGDILLIATAGAYGHSMASNYNLRPPAREVILD